ncbi:hypothetical protein [Arenibaculum pallidiluteum]|uniref:hypothetical protein n=1 Tax=Arenibaculum pallidiluteum TaxID=2812559 RepID=UPI001A9673E2|nr:hypothetical protein [Arenibaculum pallidiluteum]
MLHQITGPVFLCAAVVLVLIGLAWAVGGYDGMSLGAGLALTLGIAAPVAVGFAFMEIIVKGRRSRRDRMVDRTRGSDG